MDVEIGRRRYRTYALMFAREMNEKFEEGIMTRAVFLTLLQEMGVSPEELNNTK